MNKRMILFFGILFGMSCNTDAQASHPPFRIGFEETCFFKEEVRENYDAFVDSALQQEIVNFKADICKLEKKWYSWLYCDNSCYRKVSSHKTLYDVVSMSSYVGFVYQEGKIMGTKREVRLDGHSPWFLPICSASTDEWGEQNALENRAYHDELKFIETRLALIKMYEQQLPLGLNWHSDTYKTHEEEYKQLISDQGRQLFARSYLNTSDFKTLSQLRNKYKSNQGIRDLQVKQYYQFFRSCSLQYCLHKELGIKKRINPASE